MKKTAIPLLGNILIAFALWTIMFSPWTAPYINFWACMTASALILTIVSFLWGGPWWKTIDVTEKSRYAVENVFLGIGIAIALWGVFWVGDKFSQWMFPSFARAQVNHIYEMKNGFSPCLLSLALLFIIGPAEEIFWRGYVQRRLSQRWNVNVGFVVTLALYTLIHVWSFNFMLLMAALMVGAFWGLLYRLRPQWLTALVISHAVWDACAFVFFPF